MRAMPSLKAKGTQRWPPVLKPKTEVQDLTFGNKEIIDDLFKKNEVNIEYEELQADV